jgi:hypothetical protein
VDDVILYMPRGFRFFEAPQFRSHTGFIMIEYVWEVSLESLDATDKMDLAKRTIYAVQHLLTISAPAGQQPEPSNDEE